MNTKINILILFFFSIPIIVFADQKTDEDQIINVVYNYVDGWWEGDYEKMDKCLHPDLVKRSIYIHNKTGQSMINDASKSAMVGYTKGGGGKDSIEEKGEVKITILDINLNIASVKATSLKYVDYIHLVKWNGEWVIINVLWE